MPACHHCAAPMGDEYDADTNTTCSVRCAVESGAPIDGATAADVLRSYCEELAEAAEGACDQEELVARGVADLLSWLLLGGEPASELLRKQITAWREGYS